MDVKKWIVANLAVVVVAYILYAPLAHGFTGGHGYSITFAQFLAHTIALSWVSIAVGTIQVRLLRSFLVIPTKNFLLYMLAFNLAFWIGYYSKIPGLDSLLMFPILGCGLWIFNEKFAQCSWQAFIKVPFMHLVGVIIGIGLIAVVNTQIPIVANSQKNIWAHGSLWLLVGIPSMLLGTYQSGSFLQERTTSF